MNNNLLLLVLLLINKNKGGGQTVADTDTFATPDVVGKTEKEAEQSISDSRLATNITRVFSTQKNAGVVLLQDPPAGSPLVAGDKVTLTVSLGAPKNSQTDHEKLIEAINNVSEKLTIVSEKLTMLEGRIVKLEKTQGMPAKTAAAT
jgi:hypothetical protein